MNEAHSFTEAPLLNWYEETLRVPVCSSALTCPTFDWQPKGKGREHLNQVGPDQSRSLREAGCDSFPRGCGESAWTAFRSRKVPEWHSTLTTCS